jgi:hypothetical protein
VVATQTRGPYPLLTDQGLWLSRQSAYQRGDALTAAGTSTMVTSGVPIVAVLAAVTAARGDVLIEAHLSLQLAGHILVIVDYYLLAVSPLPGPVMRTGQHHERRLKRYAAAVGELT